MSSVNGVGSSGPVYSVNPAVLAKVQSAASSGSRGSDRVELSGLSGLLDKLKANDIRSDKVASVKSQIDAGTYDTDDKLDGSLDKLLDDLNK